MNSKALRVVWCVSVLCGLLAGGCGEGPSQTGFLSDYSQLEPDASDMRYIDQSKLATYSMFIVEPVTVHFHSKATGKDTEQSTLDDLTSRMRSAIVDELSEHYAVVSRGGPGVALVRVALTDVNKDTPALNILPTTKLTGLGLGGAAMEGELLDSVTREQIGAVIQTQKGQALSLQGLTEWSSAEAVINGWAKKFRQRLDEAHGRK